MNPLENEVSYEKKELDSTMRMRLTVLKKVS